MTSEGKGWGLRTLDDLPKGAFVCEYIGEILTNIEVHKRNMNRAESGKMYQVYLDSGWDTTSLKDDEALCLDATYYANIARFINHRLFHDFILLLLFVILVCIVAANFVSLSKVTV